MSITQNDVPMPRLMPLGDSALLVRFGDRIDMATSAAVIAFARTVKAQAIPGVVEIVPNLVSVLLRYDPLALRFDDLAAEIRLLVSRIGGSTPSARSHTIGVRFGGSDGPDVQDAAGLLGISCEAFIARHNRNPLRVLATGFAPGFVYCGLHDEDMKVARRATVRDRVPVGSVLFAAGQTAITSTSIPTGWHVIGRTDFSNFDPARSPPTWLQAGDEIVFEAVP